MAAGSFHAGVTAAGPAPVAHPPAWPGRPGWPPLDPYGRPAAWPPAPPAPPSALARRWPALDRAPHPVLLGAVGAAAAVAASTVPLDGPGLGWTIATLAAVGALAATATTRARTASAPATAPPGPAADPRPAGPGRSGPTTFTEPLREERPPAPGPATTGPTDSAAEPPTAEAAAERPTAEAAQEPPTAEAAQALPSAASVEGPPPAGSTAPAPDRRPSGSTRDQPSGPAVPAEDRPPAGPAALARDRSPGGDEPATEPDEAAARPGATGAPGRAARLVWAAATVALVGVGTMRAAGWLFALCLLAAIMTGTLALTGARTPLGMLLSVVFPPSAALRALPWAARGLHRARPGGIGRGLATLAVSVALLVLFGLLFASADAIFASLVADLLPDVSPSGVVPWVLRFALAGAVLLGAAYLLARPPDLEVRPAPARPVRRLEWAAPLVVLDALFAAFVLVQLTVLFGGSAHVLRTAGLTYAEYARSGFWQLLVIAGLTLLVIAGAARWAPRATRGDRLLIRALLGTLTLLSLVVVASALYRMHVYAEAYGATRLRLVVAAVEIWLGLLFVLVGVATVRLRARWLPQLVLGTAVLALLGLAAVNPDHLIADRNVDRYRQTGRLDVRYLASLSADAAPALARLPEPLRSCALRDIAVELGEDDLRSANLGRARARRLLADQPVRPPDASCLIVPRW
ncbi:DUF4173 domain-containing protein [Micromonospora globbae]|uniref:DUF4173 domain-containing protein n=2 Tax=Micromonospora globbae TaxID=1894969 RepID=A0A420EUJ7_9ACTN|nr:DUF4173 domain-containing protein [Micromonospora globbae]